MAPQPIAPRPPEAVRRQLLERLLGTRSRDLGEVEAAHRDLIAADDELHRKLLVHLAGREPESVHLMVGLALLATGPDPIGRRLVTRLVRDLPIATVADVVDYVHGWQVEVVHRRREKKRYTDRMAGAYKASSQAVLASLGAESAESANALRPSDEFVGGEILITLGQYDRVQQVLDTLGLPYRTLPCYFVPKLPLRADQCVIVNCPGKFSAEGIEKLRRFVAAGGTLITTDWALKTTLEQAFPGVLEYNQRPTGDDVVEVSWVDPDNHFTRDVRVAGQTIRWWLEGSSYPIKIVDPRVHVLVRSAEMGKKYGEDPLVVAFAYGEGMVFHLTSHYYLQRSKVDAERTAGKVTDGELAAAYSSLRLIANVLFDRRRACGV